MKKINLLLSIILFAISLNAHAVNIIPRIGIDAGGIGVTDSLNSDSADTEDEFEGLGFGVNAGVAIVMKDNFIDLSLNLIPYGFNDGGTDTNMPNSGIRSEFNAIYGHRLTGSAFGIVGYRQLGYSEELFGGDSFQKGILFGVNLNNMNWHSKLLSVTFAQIYGESVTPERSSGSKGHMIKLAWREKDAHGLWHFKVEQFKRGIDTNFMGFGYTYLFY